MQNSERFRRGVVLPLDDQAERNLRFNDVDETTHVLHLPIDSEVLFDRLWSSGLFSEINSRCGALIDDYEEDFVEPAEIPSLLLVVEGVARGINGVQSEAELFLADLHSLAMEAMGLQRPLLFVL